MVTPAVEGIDLFKIAGRSISGWMPSLKTGTAVRQPFCSQLEERLLLWLEYHPQVQSSARGDIGHAFATAYRLPMPTHAPFAIGYAFEDQPHDYLPDVVGTLTNGKLFIAEAGMEDDKRRDRNLAKAEAARRLARLPRGGFWVGTGARTSQRLPDHRALLRQPPSHALRAGCFRVRRWMPPRCLRHNGSTFTGISGLWSWCWAGQPTRAAPRRRASPGRRWGGW